MTDKEAAAFAMFLLLSFYVLLAEGYDVGIGVG